jgi:hypothetical protein
MYGDQALKLMRELKRYPDTLPPFNDSGLQQVQRETAQVFAEGKRTLEKVQKLLEESMDDQMPPIEQAKINAAVAILGRNKRCLLAYARHRRLQIEKLAWDLSTNRVTTGDRPPPAKLATLMSAEERQYYSRYSGLISEYASNYTEFFDLTAPLVPPQSIYIQVEAVVDLNYETADGSLKALLRGHKDYVKRSDVERFIQQGYLIHCE